MKDSNNYNKVFELDVSNASLKILNEEILNYTNLKVLNISGNQLKELPEFLKELKHLEKINISNNQLTKLPDFFRNFKELTELNVSNNPLVTFPFSFWKLSRLKKLNISGLNLKELPIEIGNLKELKILTINESGLTFLPETLGYLDKLEDLSLKNNQLTKLPKTFVASYIKRLKKLNLRENKFQVFPKSIFDFKDLEYLNVSGNSIKAIPKQIGFLKELTYLNISENKIRSIPRSLFSLDLKRTHFHFKNNPLSKVFLDEINKKIPNKEKEHQTKKKKLEEPKKKVVHKSFRMINEIEYSFDRLIRMFLPLLLLVLIPTYFYVINSNDKKVKIKQDTINKDSKKEYVLAKQNFENSLKRMLKKTEEVYVYTNDVATLKLTIRPNAKFNKKEYQDNHDNKRKAKYINKFLNNKRYGYSVDIDNGRTKFAQLWLHDSVIAARFSKKFRVVRYYRMTLEEKEYNIERDRKRLIYRKKPRNDKVFAINRGIVDFKELKNKRFSVETRAIFTPRDIDITRRENYFYFTSLHSNITKEEFLEAVAEFKEMFITKGNPDELCVVKTLTAKRE